MFKLFEEVIYPAYGVAKICREINKEVNSEMISFFELKFINKDVTILIPQNGMRIAGVRYLSNYEEMVEAFNILESIIPEDFLEKIILVSWNRRSKEYHNKIREGNIKDLAYIYRDLRYLESTKGLSFAEKNILLQVENLLSEECMAITRDTIQECLEKLKSKTSYERNIKKTKSPLKDNIKRNTI